MKTLFLLNFFLLFVVSVNAQNYQSFFGEEDTRVIYIHDDGTLGEDPRFLDSLSITTEVVSADGEILKKADRFKYNQTEPPISFYYRENLEEGKLWYRPTIDAEEFLIADLSLEIGDTTEIFSPFFGGNDNPLTVSDIVYDGNYKIIYFETSWYVEIFIKEGVLPMMFSEQVTLPEGFECFFTYFTICVEKDGNQVFRIDEIWDIDIENPNNNWVSCELIDFQNLSNETFDEHQYKIYPNPTLDKLNIDAHGNTVNHIELFDVQGKRVMTTSLANSNQVDVSHLSPGIYFIKLDTGKNSIIHKFVKK
jgi:hypothetical protein